MSTKLNVNIRTLLASCEELAKDEQNNWRLRKFIKSLDTMIEELKESDEPQIAYKIDEYVKRLDKLKSSTNYVHTSKPYTMTQRSTSPSGMETGNEALREIRQLQTSKHFSDLRKELFDEDQLRQRKPTDLNAPTENMSEAVKYYNEAQEKITEHMLSLTRNLKEQTETANRIIKKDTEIVSMSTGMADKNMSSLHKEAQKLDDHSRNAWKCWMWMMIVFVIVVFIGMVLFMKIMKKKRV